MPYRMPGTRTVIDYAGASVTGRHREINEDAWGAIESASVFIVADGGGGESSGRMAADLAVTSFRRYFSGREAGMSQGGLAPPGADPLAVAVLEANTRILQNAVGDSVGMGCALIGLRLAPPWLISVSAGDCRLYRYRRGYDPATYASADETGGELRRLSMDDVLALEMWRTGATLDQAAEIDQQHPNVVTRIVGIRPDLDVSVSYFPLLANDLYLLCSDGITRQLDDYTIRAIISNDEEDLSSRCDALVQAADEQVGADNVTAVLLHLV
ncbi:MAG: serine/threonine-protein phosphatase [Labilithrix sp.]|nr:serine/threonine-protein phosphatase [Labilithrix sp.]MCW5815288.1 serine/threonine-protein phosphatase [Labilithrix sp.]